MTQPHLTQSEAASVDDEASLHAEGELHVPAAENQLFDGVPGQIVEQVVGDAEKIQLRAGDVIFEDASLGQYCYLVEAGLIDISKRGEGGVYRTIGSVGPGEFFGELALFHSAPRIARATAATAAELVLIDRHSFEAIRSSASAALATTLAEAGVRRLEAVHAALLRNLSQAEDREAALALSEITHNLRTPLVAIASDVRYLVTASAAESLDGNRLRRHLADILRSADSGVRYADSLLRHLQEEQPVLSEVSVRHLVRAAVERTAEPTGWIDTRLEITAESPRSIEGDESALIGAIADLIGASLGRIESDEDLIRVSAANRERGVEISITTHRCAETVGKRRRVEDESYPQHLVEHATQVVDRHRGRLGCECLADHDAISIWLPTLD